MLNVSRRTALRIAGGVTLGIGAFGKRLRWPGFYGGALEATTVSAERVPSEDLVVAIDDDRIVDVGPVQEVTRRAVVGPGRVSLSQGEYRTVASTLGELPYYDPAEEREHASGRAAVIVADDENETTWRLRLTPYCGRLFDARDDGISGREPLCTDR